MSVVCDTNIVSAMMRGEPQVERHWLRLSPEALLVPTIVLAEGFAGAEKAGSQRWRAAWTEVERTCHILPFDAICARCYGHLRSDLESRGLMIGLHDCQIAATALAWQQTHPGEELVLITDNEREFRRVPGLQVENWLLA